MTGYCEKCATRVHTSDHGTRCESCLIAERDEAVRLLRWWNDGSSIDNVAEHAEEVAAFLARVSR